MLYDRAKALCARPSRSCSGRWKCGAALLGDGSSRIRRKPGRARAPRSRAGRAGRRAAALPAGAEDRRGGARAESPRHARHRQRPRLSPDRTAPARRRDTSLAHEVAEAQQNRPQRRFHLRARAAAHGLRAHDRAERPARPRWPMPTCWREVVLRTKGVVLDSLLEDEAMTRAERDPDVRDMMEKRRLLALQLGAGGRRYRGRCRLSQRAGRRSPSGRSSTQEEQQIEASLRTRAWAAARPGARLPPRCPMCAMRCPDGRGAGRVRRLQPIHGPAHLAARVRRAGADARRADPQWVPLGSAADIDARVRVYQKYMQRRVREAALSRRAAWSLRIALPSRSSAALPGGIAPADHQPRRRSEFRFLRDAARRQDRFLAEDFELSYVSSGRDLLLRHRCRRATSDWSSSPIPTTITCPARRGTPRSRRAAPNDDDVLDPLPGTEREAAFLQQEAKSDGSRRGGLSRRERPRKANLAQAGFALRPAPGHPRALSLRRMTCPVCPPAGGRPTPRRRLSARADDAQPARAGRARR